MPRPKIGIALGAGVARGWTHIGVLKALKRAGIEPDIVSGTSIGALVGGCLVADRLEPLEDFARSLTRRRMLSLLDFRFRSSGLIGDSKLAELMREQLSDIDIENLTRTFVGVATELTTGHELWLHKGNLIQAIRASYALPGVFAPVAVDGRWLIDGALVNPVPVSVARALGARVVIAVNLNTDPFDPAARRRAHEAVHPGYIRSSPPPLPDDDLFHDIEDRIEEELNLQEDAEQEEEDASEGAAELVKDAAETTPAVADRIRQSLKNFTWKRNPERELMRRVIGGNRRGPGIASVMLASLNIVQDRLARMRMAGDPPDIMIAPRVGHLSLLDFDRADELIRLGEEAAEEAIPQILETIEIMQ
ncbi:patatin-like phospholipase family protein [Parvibaculum sp.]|uniref:patatin-like phospholipase family protein n=1 Tax=Parvibaculum sp. TaxID=2024848 RepID=UPI0027321246|nr:patatin-like phospholipase family protein [Parvibaculum sp.]MDP1627206.1 patatin-like phospholipase family protein [Parvibaculum sp.]MDP2148912.1 patatin-like phospholipase family protein [Parvibaculum sp.]MDP3327774.1 patatin-like phospholipase family protein [Parvibaculum sp.]